jgi:hypothetical protein
MVLAGTARASSREGGAVRNGFKPRAAVDAGGYSGGRWLRDVWAEPGNHLRCKGLRMVDATGIEPVTPSMSTRCSPAELRVRQSGPEALRKASRAGRCGGIAAAFGSRKPTYLPPGEKFRRPSSFRLRKPDRAGARAWTTPWRRPGRGPGPTGPRRRSR